MTKEKPAVICDDRLFSASSKFCGRYATQRLPNLMQLQLGKAFRSLKRSHDLGDDAADAGAGQADCTRSGGRKIENPAADEGAPVIDGNDNAAVAMGYPEPGAKGQRSVSAGHGLLVETLTRGGLAAGFIAIKGGDAREGPAGSRRRGDRSIGVAPAGSVAGVVVVIVAMAVVVMPIGPG